MKQSPLKIAFIHPDLGIGGAEQLIINLALALKEKGHKITIFTPHHDKNHCFEPTKDGTLEVKVHGNIFPRTIFGKMWALCAMIRVLICSLYVIFFGGQQDVIIVDQVSFCLPFLNLFRKKTLFYCHFPDKLLCVERSFWLKRIYRCFIDYFEEISLLFANKIVVNSAFTQQIYKDSFKKLAQKQKIPQILYPTVDFSKFHLQENEVLQQTKPFFLSINRYERKKNIQLAINSFALFVKNNQQCELIIAGGYDERIKENVEHLQELKSIAKSLNIEDKVVFKLNISHQEKVLLLSKALGVLYTPPNEHFGIVPVECMYMERVVLALNSGGPKESIDNGKCGFLLEDKNEDWALKMDYILKNQSQSLNMGKKGKERAIKMFGFQSFSDQIDKLVKEICNNK